MRVPDRGVKYKASWRAFLANYLIGAGLLTLSVIMALRWGVEPDISGFGGLLHAVVWAAAAWLFLEPLIDGILRRYLVSASEVVKVEGVFRKSRHAIPYQSVSEVTVKKGLLGMLLNYGTVEVEGVRESGGGITMRNVHNPDEIRRLIRHRVDGVRSTGRRVGKPDFENENDEKDDEHIRLE